MQYDPNTFTSEAAALKFYLTQTDGAVRTRLLGVTDRMYQSKQEADAWLAKMQGILNEPGAPAEIALLRLHSIMTYSRGEER